MGTALFNYIHCWPVNKLWDFASGGTCWPVDILVNYDIFSAGNFVVLDPIMHRLVLTSGALTVYLGVVDAILALIPWRIVWGL